MAESTQSNPHHQRRWLILGILGIAQLMVVLDATVVNIALPSAQRALHFTNDNRQWIVTAYALTFGSLLLFAGRLSDLFGRKWTIVAGLVGFAIASAVGGAAQSFGMLVGARAVQGAFGALLAPAGLSLLTTTFTDLRERGQAFGIYGAIAGSGASIGLLLGGVLTSALNWRYTMFVNLIFAVVAVIGALALLVNQRPAERPHFDIPGTVAITAGLFALVYGLNRAETLGWGSSTTIAFLAAAGVLIAAFGAIERRAAHPLLPLRIVADRNRGGALASIGLSAVAIFAVFLFLTYFMQQNLGFSPVVNGVAFLPLTATIILSATLSSTRLLPRFGPRWLISGGMLLGALGMFLLTRLGVHSSYAGSVLPSLIVMGLGFGLIFAPGIATATLGVDADDAGVASAAVNANQQVGGSVGVALLSTIAASATSSYIAGHHASASLAAAGTIHGYTVAFAWAGGIFLFGAAVAALLIRNRAARVGVRSGEGQAVAAGSPAPVEPHPTPEPVLAH